MTLSKALMSTILLSFALCCDAQSRLTYFKASKSYTVPGDSKVKDGTVEVSGPFDTDDAVMFDLAHNQIIIVSETAQVYDLISTTLKKAANGNPFIKYGSNYIQYAVTDAKGKKATILFIATSDKSDKYRSRVIIKDNYNPVSILDGTIKTVY